MRVDQKMARICYERRLKNHRGTYTITNQVGGPSLEADPCDERRPGPVGDVRELVINGKRFKLRASLCKELEDKIVEVISKNMNTFAWSSVDMPGIDPDFLCH